MSWFCTASDNQPYSLGPYYLMVASREIEGFFNSEGVGWHERKRGGKIGGEKTGW